MTADFYRALEDRHRGARELIKERLSVYLPCLAPLVAQHPGLPILDLGCGRGEWLELLGEKGWVAAGIDQDSAMLSACRERNLAVTQGDALQHLAAQPAGSLLAVTGFHIAEHLPFERLDQLITSARRALAPGGLLILETPNPDNLLVGAASFFIDPTHQRPLPAQLLAFLAQHHGFAAVAVWGLQHESRLAGPGPVGLYDVLAGVSPDYAIIASTAPDPATPADFAASGVSLYQLASRYDAGIEERFNIIHHQLAELNNALANVKARADGHAAELAAIYASRSWRLTRPLRWLTRQFQRNRT